MVGGTCCAPNLIGGIMLKTIGKFILVGLALSIISIVGKLVFGETYNVGQIVGYLQGILVFPIMIWLLHD